MVGPRPALTFISPCERNPLSLVPSLTLKLFRYATHPTLNGYSALIQNYFTNETLPYPAVHLTVDTELNESGEGLGVKGWFSQQLGLEPKPENCVFLPIPVVIKYADSERAGRMFSLRRTDLADTLQSIC